ncbi:hypothetical protein SALBM311S_11854 [Streptomyces alboniger]
MADRQRVAVGADHGHRPRFEQRPQGTPYGRVFATLGPGHGQGLRVDGDLEVDDLPGRPGLDAVAGAEEHVDHPGVVGEDVGFQCPDAPGAGGGGDVLQEEPAEPLALVVVPDGEGDLGVLGFLGVADVADQAGDLVAGQGDERQLVEVVDVRAAPDDVVAGADHRTERAVGQGGPGQAADEGDQTVGVLGPDGPEEGRPPGPDEPGPFQVVGVRGVRGEWGRDHRCSVADAGQTAASWGVCSGRRKSSLKVPRVTRSRMSSDTPSNRSCSVDWVWPYVPSRWG